MKREAEKECEKLRSLEKHSRNVKDEEFCIT